MGGHRFRSQSVVRSDRGKPDGNHEKTLVYKRQTLNRGYINGSVPRWRVGLVWSLANSLSNYTGLGECLRSPDVLDVHNSKQCPGRVRPQHCLRLWTRQLVWFDRLQPQAVAPVRYD